MRSALAAGRKPAAFDRAMFEVGVTLTDQRAREETLSSGGALVR